MCVYGEKKVHQQLLSEGYNVALNTVSRYRQELGIKAVVAVKSISTTVSDDKHPKCPYLLKGINVDRPNKVWLTDITYCQPQPKNVPIRRGKMYHFVTLFG